MNLFLVPIISNWHNMSKSNNHVVCTWMNVMKNIQKQKYYTSQQPYEVFRHDTKIDRSLINVITKQAFACNLNTYADQENLFYKITEGFPAKVRYILLDMQDVAAFEQKTLRISPRKRVIHRNLTKELQSEVVPTRSCSLSQSSTTSLSSGGNHSCSTLQSEMAHATPSAMPSGNPSSHMAISLPNSAPSNIPTNIPSLQSLNLSCSLSSTNHADKIRNMKKSQLPSTLKLFMGKYRAQQIFDEKSNVDNTTSFKNEIENHLMTQIERLKNAYLSDNGWKALVSDYEELDKFSSYYIFDLCLKAFYLQKLYSMASKYHSNGHDCLQPQYQTQ